MVTVKGRFFPLLRHFMGKPVIGICGIVPDSFQHFGIRRQRTDRLDRQIAVMGKMPGKVVGAELIIRIVADLHQIICPLLQDHCMFCKAGHILPGKAAGSHAQQHIAAFLHRHLRILGIRTQRPMTEAKAVYLPIGQGIGAYIMGRIFICPQALFQHPEHRLQHTLHQLRGIHQKQRHRRIRHIHCGNTAVGIILL